MYKTKIFIVKRNGRPKEKGLKIEVSESIDYIEDLKEALLSQNSSLKMGDMTIFYSNEGVMLAGHTLVLVKDGDTIFMDPYGKKFDEKNILEQYQIVSKLGKGGFGSVHKAQHIETGNQIAIKFIDITECLYNASKVEEIYKEAQALMKMNHPNIVKLHHAFVVKNEMILIMELVSGGELMEYIKQKGSLSECESRMFLQQIVDTVGYFHNKCIIHRDLKPENILLTDLETKKIKIIDFGIAGSNYNLDPDKTTAGSLRYLPPEAFEALSLNADPAVDIWAMGVIFYVMLFGAMPFNGINEKEIVKSITNKKTGYLKQKKKVTPQCTKLLDGMLMKKRDERMKIEDIISSDWYRMPEEELQKMEEDLLIVPTKQEEIKLRLEPKIQKARTFATTREKANEKKRSSFLIKSKPMISSPKFSSKPPSKKLSAVSVIKKKESGSKIGSKSPK